MASYLNVKKIGTEIRDVPCELCQRMDNITQEITHLRHEGGQNQPAIDKLNTARNQINNQHPKCAACGILFGGMHENEPSETPLGDMCGSCAQSFKKMGPKAFHKRMAGKLTIEEYLEREQDG